MSKLQPLTLPATPGALKVTEDQRGDLETVGPWHIPVRFKAPAIDRLDYSG